jgi:Helix-turn-helix domain
MPFFTKLPRRFCQNEHAVLPAPLIRRTMTPSESSRDRTPHHSARRPAQLESRRQEQWSMAPATAPMSPAAFSTFGELLRYLRRRQRLTQIELAIAVGYSTAQISRLEQINTRFTRWRCRRGGRAAIQSGQDHGAAADTRRSEAVRRAQGARSQRAASVCPVAQSLYRSISRQT